MEHQLKSARNSAQCNLVQADSQKTNSIRSFELLKPEVIWEVTKGRPNEGCAGERVRSADAKIARANSNIRENVETAK